MGGSSTTSQQSQQQSQTSPWGPAQPGLQSILSAIMGQMGNYQPTGAENQALGQLTSNSQNLFNFGPQATNLAQSYMGGDPSGLLNPALKNYQAQLNPIANQNNDPMQTPGIRSLLDTIRGDVSKQVNSQFAGAGRDLSGLNQQYLSRGVAQGEAAPLLAQYNQNVAAQTGAAGNLYNASGNTASALGANQMQGLNIANLIPQLQNQGPMGVLAAQQMARMLPLQNLGMLANLLIPIAGLGGQSEGSSASQSKTSLPWWSSLQAIASLFPKVGGGGGGGGGTG